VMAILRGEELEAPLPCLADTQQWKSIRLDFAKHGLVFIFYRWLKERRQEHRLPELTLAELKVEACRQAAVNLMYAQELSQILRIFHGHAIRCAPLRGLRLGELLYGDMTQRPSGDIDVLVSKDSVSAVTAALTEFGYEELDRRPGFARTYSYTLEFVKHQHGWITVEPHWTLAYPPFAERLDMEAVWRRASRTEFLGAQCWHLDPADLLLHLCLHLVHGGAKTPLLWYMDLDRLVRSQPQLNWSILIRQATTTGQAALVARALRAVQSTLQTPIPDSVIQELDSYIGSDDRSFTLLIASGSSIDGVESFALALSLTGFRRITLFVWSILFPSRRFMQLHHGLTSSSAVAPWYAHRLYLLVRESLKAVGIVLFQRFFPRSL
jgi:Uncharacterised nucleotidyltransferase